MVKINKVFKAVVIIIITIFLSSCDSVNSFLGLDKQVSADILNYISTEIINSNVKLEIYEQEPADIRFPVKPRGTGSAVIIKKEGKKYYIITNNHVVTLSNNTSYYIIEDSLNNRIRAYLVLNDEDYDLAILEFQTNDDLLVMELASKNPKKGELVFSIGSPEGKRNIITVGRILSYQDNEEVDYQVIFHSAVIRTGSSGSMLINEDYKIVGINTWGLKDKIDSEYVEGMATPVEKINEFLEKHDFKIK